MKIFKFTPCAPFHNAMFRHEKNIILLYSGRYVWHKLKIKRLTWNWNPNTHISSSTLCYGFYSRGSIFILWVAKHISISNNMTGKHVRFALNVLNKFERNLSLNIWVLQLCLCTVGRVNCCWLSTAQSLSQILESWNGLLRATNRHLFIIL